MSSTRNRHNIQLAAFYFPDYHCDERMEKEHGPGWTEWDVVQAARSRFPGHRQPKVPLWGYGDESEPEVMAKKIAAAADHGIGTFLFDWYWYGEKPFLEGALKRGFLNAPNRHRMTYALMWANHPWRNMHPHGWNEPVRTLLESDVSPRSFDRLCGILLEEHLQRPEYWTICGKPFFSIYDITRLCENFGGIPPLRKALDQFRARAERVGLAGLHLNLTSRGETILPGERKSNAPELVEELGFDSKRSRNECKLKLSARDGRAEAPIADPISRLLGPGGAGVFRTVLPEHHDRLGRLAAHRAERQVSSRRVSL